MAYTEELGNYSCPDLPREPDLPRYWDAGAFPGAAGRRPRTGIAVAAAHTTLQHPDPVGDHANSAGIRLARRLTIEAAVNL